MREYHLGYAARIAGKSHHDNPYDAFTQGIKFDTWKCGWLDADDYLKQKDTDTK